MCRVDIWTQLLSYGGSERSKHAHHMHSFLNYSDKKVSTQYMNMVPFVSLKDDKQGPTFNACKHRKSAQIIIINTSSSKSELKTHLC